MSHHTNCLNSHITIEHTLHSCQTINWKVNCGLTPSELFDIASLDGSARVVVGVDQSRVYVRDIFLLLIAMLDHFEIIKLLQSIIHRWKGLLLRYIMVSVVWLYIN